MSLICMTATFNQPKCKIILMANIYQSMQISSSTKQYNLSHRFKVTSFDSRALSTIQTKTKPKAIATAMVSKEEARDFMAMFPDIVRDLTDAGRHTDIPEVTKRFAKVLQYNVPNGKKNRGLSVVAAYKILEQNENLTPENVRLANLLGWCVEMVSVLDNG